MRIAIRLGFAFLATVLGGITGGFIAHVVNATSAPLWQGYTVLVTAAVAIGWWSSCVAKDVCDVFYPQD